jgi:hypothetical protein
VGSQSAIHQMLTGRRRARATIALMALAGRIVTVARPIHSRRLLRVPRGWRPAKRSRYGQALLREDFVLIRQFTK